jgi:phospholipid/cholesterol/gamma-HCH transport system substrate-binding protein
MRTKNPVRRFRAGKVAALACVSALALSGCDFDVYSLPLPGGADLGDDPYSVKVEFRDVLDLVPQSSVKVNDVTVGKVTDVELDGYHAQVTLALNDEVELPDNAVAEIRQTSLLGEKFVSLAPPEAGASPNLLGEGDVITLDRSGRNPEVEEVLGAMSLLLNGGGVAQLKTISAELNKAFEGRESDVRSVLNQLDTFMGQLDENKEDIVQAIESLNSLAVSINEQRGSIELALDEMPAALQSIDKQRDDLVKMLDALNELSAVGTDVIRQSKAATIDSLESLDPVLTKLAEAGDSLPKAFQVFLTYPFVDEVVGRNPAQARNLHMGDYTNLSVQMDIDLTKGLPELPGLPGPQPPIDPIETVNDVTKCLNTADPDSKACQDLGPKQAKKLCEQFPQNPICDALVPGSGEEDGGDGGDGGGDNPLPLPLPGLGRAVPGPVFFGAPTVAAHDGTESAEELGYEPTLGALLIQGMVQR